ncbi:MAG TPA: COX15/CtaA family protein [Lunatimonas sp.]|nr:COX15/CtaA family protein [Lunatimonas sp.]
MNIKDRKNIDSFRRISLITTAAIYFLILVGGIVRSTGSGMGCPDWPKCFGSWIPPTSVDQLPNDYLEVYVQQRLAKNERFADMLASIGFSELGQQILQDESVAQEEPFNATKTWIEYINRLIGAVIGILVLITVYRAILIWKLDRRFTYLSISALVLVLFQGWIGSIVVSTNLLQWMITVHMLLALVIVCLLLYIYFLAYQSDRQSTTGDTQNQSLGYVIAVCMLLMVIQIVLGTQVREEVDEMARKFSQSNRDSWIEGLGITFLIHRSYSLLILALHLVFGYLVFKQMNKSMLIYQLTFWLLAIIVLEILSGVGMAYFGIPAFLQPLHLLFGTLIVGIQFFIWLEIRHSKFALKKVAS